jgi:heme-degrading monooxygenase HmoA
MHARMTRYEGATPDAVGETLEAKKGVLPTELGQTEGMKGVVFLVDRESGTVVVISLWQDEEAMQAGEDEATRVREEVTRPGETASVERYEVVRLSIEQAGGVPQPPSDERL